MSRYLQRLRRYPDKAKMQRWLAFLQNHRELMVAFDFFTVPTLSFRVLYCFFVIEHHQRRILHFNTTAHPTSEWIVQQLREALPLPGPYRYVIFDRDRKFSTEVRTFLKASGIQPVRMSVRSPWQKGYASYCTSWAPGATTSLMTLRSDSFTPCALRGGWLPGCSNRHSFLSL